jgi:hypothetical protein
MKSIHKKSDIPKKWHIVHYINKDGEVRTRVSAALGIQPTSSRSVRRDALDTFPESKPEVADEKEPTGPPSRQQEVEKAPNCAQRIV